MVSLIVVMLVTVSTWATEGYNDLAKLVKSKTSDDIIIAFISSSTVSYALSADEIIRLKDMGASSGVITAAIRHRKPVVTERTEQPAVVAQGGTDNTVVYENAVVQPEPDYYPYWTYPTYIDLGWGWGGGGRYYHRGGSGHYRGGYSTGHVSGGGSPSGGSGTVSRSAASNKRAR